MVGADLDAAVKSINDFVKTTKNGFANVDGAIIASTNEFKRLQSLLSKTEDPRAISVYQKRLQDLAATLSSQIPPAAAKSAAALNNVNKAVANANPTLVNFGRVVQDAPFGIIGIANNIDPLISSFQSLKASTGSTGAALKSLFSALAGPAGIAIGVSAVTSALIAFGPQIAKFFEGNKQGAASAAAAAEAVESLDKAVAEFATTAQAAAGKEISGLDSLVKGIKNVNLSQQQRLFYVDELQKKYPAYFGNLTNEQILAGQTGDAYKRLTADILAASKARAAQDVLSKIAAQQLAVLEKKALLAAEAERQITEARTGTRIVFGGSTTGTSTGSVTITAEEKQKFARDQLALSTKSLDLELKKLTDQANFYVEFVDAGAAATANLGQKQVAATKATNSQASAVKELAKNTTELKAVTAEKLEFLPIGSIAQLNKEIQALRGQQELTFDPAVFQNYQNEIDAIALKIKEIQGGILPEIDTEVQALRNYAAAMKSIFDQTGDKDEEARLLRIGQTAEFAAGQITDLFNQSFTAISQGESPIKAITNSLKGLIVRLVAAAAAAALLSALLPGGTAIGGVVAGGGQGFGALFGSLFGLASGGIASRPTPALIGDGGPEAVIPLSQLANIIGGVAMQMGGGGGGNLSIVRGQDIYYSNNNASRSFGRLFG